MTIIKHTHFHREFYKILHDILHRDPLVIFLQLFFVIDLTKQNAFHSNVWFYDEREPESCFSNFLFHLVVRQIMHNVDSSWYQVWRKLIVHFLFSFAFKTAERNSWIG